MKSLKLLVLTVFVASATLVSQAQTPQKLWTGTGTALSNAVECVSWVVATAFSGSSIPNQPAIYGPAVLGYINCKSDGGTPTIGTGSSIAFYICTNSYPLTLTNIAGQTGTGYTNLAVSDSNTNALVNGAPASNQVCIIRHKASDTYEIARIYGSTQTNILLKSGALGVYSVTAVAQGDILYCCQAAGTIALAAATATTIGPIGAGGGIASGVFPERPFLIEVVGTNSVGTLLNVASGFFAP